MGIPTVSLAGKQVGRVGLGIMMLTWTANPVPDEQAFAAMKAGVDAGATSWSSATFYGNPPGEDGGFANLRLIGRFLAKYPEYKGKVQLVVKGCVGPNFTVSSDYELNKGLLETAKEALQGVPIDVYLPARIGPGADPVEFFAPLEKLRKEGYFTALGASEVSAATLRSLSSHYEIAVVEIEVSLWSYAQDIQDVIAWSKETKVPVYAYSPLGRGFLTRQWEKPEDIPQSSMQAHMPRFQGEAFYHNLQLVDLVEEFAKERGLTNAQVAIAWVIGLSPYTIPLPASSKPERVTQNVEAANIKLTEEEKKRLDAILAKVDPSGPRYAEGPNSTGLLMR